MRLKTLPKVANLGSVRAFELKQVDFGSCVVNHYLHKFPILNLISGKTMSAWYWFGFGGKVQMYGFGMLSLYVRVALIKY